MIDFWSIVLAALVCLLGFYVTDWLLRKFQIGLESQIVGIVWFLIFILMVLGRIPLPF